MSLPITSVTSYAGNSQIYISIPDTAFKFQTHISSSPLNIPTFMSYRHTTQQVQN